MTEPLRLLLWHWGRRGGGPRYTLELARAMKSLPDVNVHLSYSRQCELVGEFRDLGVPSLEVDTYNSLPSCVARTLLLPILVRRFSQYITQHQISVVNSTMHHLWTRLAIPAVRASSASLLVTVHDATLHPGEDSRFKRWLFAPPPEADGYLALTRFVATQLNKTYGIPTEQVSVAPHGPFPRPMPARRTGHVDGCRPLRLMFLGRILPYKGLDRLVEAYAALRARDQEMSLLIAGSGDLGELQESIERLPDVRILNRWLSETDIGQLLAETDVVVLPYVEASQSGIVADAMAAGVPVVVTPVGGLTEQVIDGRNGLVAADCSPEAIAHSLLRLATEPGLIERLRNGTKEMLDKDLSWESIAVRIVAAAQKASRQKLSGHMHADPDVTAH